MQHAIPIHRDPVRRPQQPQIARLIGRGRHFRQRDVLENRPHHVMQFHRIPRARRRRPSGKRQRPQRHLLASAARRDQPHAGLNEAHVQLQMRLPGRAVERHLCAAAERQAKRSNHYRTRAKLDRLRHLLKRRDVGIDLVPLLVLRRQQPLHQVCARRKIRGVVRDHKSAKLPYRLRIRAEVLTHEAHDVAAQRVHLGVELDASDPVSHIDQGRTWILPHHTTRPLRPGESDDRARRFDRNISSGARIENFRPAVAMPSLPTSGQQPFKSRRQRHPMRPHPLRRCANSRRVPHLERPQLPVEARPHRAIDVRHAVADLAHAVRRVQPQLRQNRPVERRRLVLLRISA